MMYLITIAWVGLIEMILYFCGIDPHICAAMTAGFAVGTLNGYMLNLPAIRAARRLQTEYRRRMEDLYGPS